MIFRSSTVRDTIWNVYVSIYSVTKTESSSSFRLTEKSQGIVVKGSFIREVKDIMDTNERRRR